MDPRRKKLQYRAWHRGFREADLILGPFADAHVGTLDEATIDEFEVLLDQPDHDLYAWIIGQTEPPSPFDCSALALIRQFRFEARHARADLGA